MINEGTVKYLFLINKIIFLVIITIYSLLVTKELQDINKNLRHAQDIFLPHKTFIEAHCGVNREIFQNTLESFSKVIEYGIDSLKADVWLTKDNVLVLVHANLMGSLKTYYNHSGNVIDLTYDELSTLGTVKDNLKMPKLNDLFKLAKNKIYIDLEINDFRVDLVFPKVVQLIEEYDFFNQLSLSSFHHEYYKKIEEYNYKNNKKLLFGFIYEINHKNPIDFSKNGNTINIHGNEITKEICESAHKNGVGVVAWFGLNDKETEENYKNLIEKGVDVIIANYPLIAKNVRDSYFK